VINNSIKFFVVFLMAFNVFAGGDDRDQAYYENLDEELAAFEAQLAEDLANQQGLEAFQQKLADDKAAAAKSNAAYQSKLANDAQVAARMEELALEQELKAFEAQLEAELAAQEMMAEIEAEMARQAALLAQEATEREIAVVRNDTPALGTVTLSQSLSTVGSGSDPILLRHGDINEDGLEDIISVIDLAPGVRGQNSPAIAVYFNTTEVVVDCPADNKFTSYCF
jgi:hypothetical protein